MIKKIFLAHHTHMDIGYTDLPEEVMDQHLNHMDKALALCEKDKDFFWTVESSRLVTDWLAARPSECHEKLWSALRIGRMELQVFETQPLTELLSADGLLRCLGRAAKLARAHGFPVKCGMIDDIGGYAGETPFALESFGVKYLVAGVGAFQACLPWAKLPHLFYLKSMSGARTLVWNLGIDRNLTPQEMDGLPAVYGLGTIHLTGPAMTEFLGRDWRGVDIDVTKNDGPAVSTEEKFAKLVKRLEAERYPYEEILLQCGGDNQGPSEHLPEVIRRLNATGKFPEIKLTTPSRFFEMMEDKHGASIPEMRGVITDPWNMRANPAPSPLKKYRAAQRVQRAALARLAAADGVSAVESEIKSVDDNIQLYADHTCGLSEWGWQAKFGAEGCRASAFDRYRESWSRKAFYAAAALDGALKADRKARKNAAPALAGGRPAVIVWNDASVRGSGPAEIYFGRDAIPMTELRDENGEDIPFQKIGHNRYLLHAEEVPAFGAKVLRPRFGNNAGAVLASPATGSFENEFLSARLSPQTGDILSLTEKAYGKEVLDSSSAHKFGAFIYQRLEDIEPTPKYAGMLRSEKSVFPKYEITGVESLFSGPVALCVRQKGRFAAPAENVSFERDLIFYHALPRIDVRLRVSKPETEKKECLYAAFPFAGKDGVFRFDQGIGMVNTSEDLLPGAMLDMFYCNEFAALDAGGFSALVRCPDAPVFQLGGIHSAQWLDTLPFRPESNHIYGHIYHNLLNTDCPVWQDILETFEWQIFPRPGAFDFGRAQKDAASAALSAEYCGGDLRAETAPLPGIEVSPDSARLLFVRPEGKDVRIGVENTLPENIRVKITFRGKTHETSLKAFGIFTGALKD